MTQSKVKGLRTRKVNAEGPRTCGDTSDFLKSKVTMFDFYFPRIGDIYQLPEKDQHHIALLLFFCMALVD